VLYLKYLKLITPPEVSGNIIVSTSDTKDKVLLPTDQAVNTTQTYDIDAIYGEAVRLEGLKVRGKATTTLTADRTAKIEFSGILVAKKY